MACKTLYEDNQRIVVADYIEKLNVVIILELPKGVNVGNGRILDGKECESEKEAFAFAEQWAKDNWVGLSENEKQALFLLMELQMKGWDFIHRSKFEDVLKDKTDEVLNSLQEKGFITYKKDFRLTEKGKEAVSKLRKK